MLIGILSLVVVVLLLLMLLIGGTNNFGFFSNPKQGEVSPS